MPYDCKYTASFGLMTAVNIYLKMQNYLKSIKVNNLYCLYIKKKIKMLQRKFLVEETQEDNW